MTIRLTGLGLSERRLRFFDELIREMPAASAIVSAIEMAEREKCSERTKASATGVWPQLAGIARVVQIQACFCEVEKSPAVTRCLPANNPLNNNDLQRSETDPDRLVFGPRCLARHRLATTH